jgi:L-lactate permease
VGLLKSLTFQTEDFQPPPDVQPQEQEKPEEQVQQAEEQVQEATEITQQWIAKRPFFLVTVEDFAAVLSWFEARPEGLDLASVTF